MNASDPSADPILLVDDSRDDVYFFRRAAAAAQLANPIEVACDGEDAVQWLENRVATREATLPTIVLLDVKMPRRNGFDVLAWIRAHPSAPLRHTPVVMFTSSQQDTDVQRAYELGANGYLVKPTSVEQLAELVRCLAAYWMLNRRLPRR